jgi:outer membrane protein TolC
VRAPLPHLAARAALAALVLALPLGAGAGCQRFTKEGADREVYGILGQRRREVAEVAGTLDVASRRRLAEAARARRTFRLTLRDALELGTVASREYRAEREDVYLAALDLTREINAFNPLWDADAALEYRGDDQGSTFDAGLGLTLERAFARGGGIVLSLASDFLRNVTGSPLRVAQSILSADVVLPLLRGSGELVARENLTQAERDVLYALRSYARFQQEFSISIASRFYRTLQSRDSWKNAEARYENLELLVQEQRAKSAYDVPKFEVDQVEQKLLEADDARQRARSSFETSVDRLKLDLGIPVAVHVELDDADLVALREAGPRAAPFDQREVLRVADRRRLDLRTLRDREADAERKVRVARDGLRAGLDLGFGGDVSTPGERPFDFGDPTASGRIGLDLDLPLERTDERNAYRRALIALDRAQRDRERGEDTVVFEVRDAYRALAQAQRSFEIQVQSLHLAEQRVESTQLLLARGDAKTRDRLDAEDALVAARDAVTAALVDHVLARLTVERDVGTLSVDAAGMWADEAPTPAPAPPAGPAPAAAPARPAPAGPAPGSAGAPGGLPPPQVIPRRSGTVGDQ